MFRTLHHLRAVGRACRCRDGAMAHRRPLVRRHSLKAAGWTAVLALVVAGSVAVSTEVTALRARIGELEDRSACLEAASADLARRWAAATGPEAVIPRAERELDLELPSAPDFVLVAAPTRDPAGEGLFARVIAGLAGGATANAAQPPVFVSGEMVTLDPAAPDRARAGSAP